MLGHPTDSVRIAGIANLELLADQHPDKRPIIAQVLVALVRQMVPLPDGSDTTSGQFPALANRSPTAADGRGRQLGPRAPDYPTPNANADGRRVNTVDTTETHTWREIEVELGDHGDTALLDRLKRRLGKAGIHRSNAPSKLARLLGPRVPRRPAPARRRPTLGAVVVAYLRE